MSQAIIKAVENAQRKTDVPPMQIGDTIDVHVRIIEGNKERVQVFNGVIIAFSGHGLTRSVRVRRIVANEGVERVFPVHSPKIARFEVKRHGHVRRSKLYYLRDRVGKKRRLRDRKRGLGSLVETAAAEPNAEASTAAPETEKATADA